MEQSLEIVTGTGTVFEDTAVVAATVGTAVVVVVAGADVAVGVVVVAGADAVVAVVGTFLQPRPGGGSADAYWVAAATTEIATTVAITASLFALVTICSPSYSRGLPVNIRPIRPRTPGKQQLAIASRCPGLTSKWN
jgi:hypothetical protein